MPCIVANSLSKSYGSIMAVDGMDLSVNSGKIFGFLGPNGAGKTTTIKLLTTLIAPEPLSTAFYLNPLTYLVDVVRAGIFGNFSVFVGIEMIVLVVVALILFTISTKLLSKLEI